MQLTRIYYPNDLREGTIIRLNEKASHYVLNVLRLKLKRQLIIFNGQGGEYQAILDAIERKIALLKIQSFQECDTESPLKITVGQGISRGERMDYAIQKSVELGVSVITPLLTSRCNVNLTTQRLNNRMAHWRGVIISACEQSGRCKIPTLNSVQPLTKWLDQPQKGMKWVCDPNGKPLPPDISHHQAMSLLIGPEGGLTTEEISQTNKADFFSLSLGPRTLRTETATVTAVTLLQARYGDLLNSQK